LPDSNTEVYINSGRVLLDSNVSCKKITVNPSAALIVVPGFTITLTGVSTAGVSQPVTTIDGTVDKVKMKEGTLPQLITDIDYAELSVGQKDTINVSEVYPDGTLAPIIKFFWQSSNTNIVTVDSGIITAKDTGNALIKVQDTLGNTATVLIRVKTSVPLVNEPIAIRFNLPVALSVQDSLLKFVYTTYKNNGKPYAGAVNLYYSAGAGELPINGNQFAFTGAGVYNVYAKYNGKLLQGRQVIIVFPKRTLNSPFLLDTVIKVTYVDINHYPWFFTATDALSDSVLVYVVRTRLEKLANNRYQVLYFTSIEKPDDLQVSPSYVAISENGSIRSVGPGKALLRATKGGAVSLPKMITVSMEYRGIWEMISSTDGYEGKLYVFDYPVKAIHSAYESNMITETFKPLLQSIYVPQDARSDLYNTLLHTDICKDKAVIGFQDFCVFACIDSGKYANLESIGGLYTCDGRSGSILYKADDEIIMKIESGHERVFKRTSTANGMKGRWTLSKHYEKDENGEFTDFPTGEYFNFKPGGVFEGVIDGGYGAGTWKVLDDNTHINIKSEGNFDFTFTIKDITGSALQLYAADSTSIVQLDFSK